jgi:polyisoprenoid-binding protein YceI
MFAVAGCRSVLERRPIHHRQSENAQRNERQEQAKAPEAETETPNSIIEPGAHESAAASQPGTYRIDGSNSRFTAEVDVGTLLSPVAHDHVISAQDLRGEVRLPPHNLEAASLEMNVRADSLVETGRDFGQRDREGVNRAVREEALETSRYPEIVFKSTRISMKSLGEGQYQAKITGVLALHGVTKSISFPAQVKVEGNILRATGEFRVLHADFNIRKLSAGAGVLTAKDPIKLSFDVRANAV